MNKILLKHKQEWEDWVENNRHYRSITHNSPSHYPCIIVEINENDHYGNVYMNYTFIYLNDFEL